MSRLSSVTVAPGTTAPDGSCTVPSTLAVSNCAQAGAANPAHSAMATISFFMVSPSALYGRGSYSRAAHDVHATLVLRSALPMADTGITVIGGGVVGLAIAARLAPRHPDLVVLERHAKHGQETSSRNSEVIHGGMYYPRAR